MRCCDERDALVTWPTTAPTTMAGVLATLEHASRRPCVDIECAPDDLTNLVESVHSSNDVLEAGERFPEMIVAAPCAADQPAQPLTHNVCEPICAEIASCTSARSQQGAGKRLAFTHKSERLRNIFS
jgi:hypothetical protein